MILNLYPFKKLLILQMCQTPTMAIQRTMCSSMKLLKYWLRKRRPGPMKAVSGRCSSLLVMCAIYRETGTHERKETLIKCRHDECGGVAESAISELNSICLHTQEGLRGNTAA